MSSSVSSTVQTQTPLPWGQDQDQLLKALTVLSDIKEKDKIQIVDKDGFKIAIENRWRITRWYTSDGCQKTQEFVAKIMSEAFFLTVLAKQQFDRKATNLDNTDWEDIDQTLASNFKELRELFGKALWGVSYLRDLYKSQEEGELVVANKLTKIIDIYVTAMSALYDKDEKRPELPEVVEPLKVPEPETSLASKGIMVVTGMSIAYASVIVYDKVMTAVQVGKKVYQIYNLPVYKAIYLLSQ